MPLETQSFAPEMTRPQPTSPPTRPATRHACRVVIALVAALAGASVTAASAAPAATAPTPRYAGRPLAEVLRTLAARGLPVLYSDELVRPEMRVGREPVGDDPRVALDQVLAEHGLAARPGPGGVLLVVRAAGAGSTAGDGAAIPAPPRFEIRDEIVVRPSRLTLLGARRSSQLDLDREEIDRLPHLARDVFRAVSLLPGTASNDVSAGFTVHGGRRDEVQILLDGQELYDAFHLADYDGALSVVVDRGLASARLATGSLPAERGDRMGGVLDLRTLPRPSGRHLMLAASLLDVTAASWGSAPADRADWLLTARGGSLALARQAIGDERPSFWDLFAKSGLRAGGRWTGRLLTTGDQLDFTRREGEDVEAVDTDYAIRYGWLEHQAAPSGRLFVATTGSWSELERDRRGATVEEDGAFAVRDRRRLTVLGVEQAWTRQGSADRVSRWGGEARRYDALFDYRRETEPTFAVIAPFAEPRPNDNAFRGTLRGDHLGLWASRRWSWSERFTAELGGRFDRHTATDDTLLSPRLAVAWQAAPNALVRAAWGRFYQSQRPYELQVEDAETRLAPAELSVHQLLGFESWWDDAPLGLEALRLELFRRTVDDPRPRPENLLEGVNFFPETEPDRVRVAPREGRAAGAELLLRGRAGGRLGWWLAYAYARAEDRAAGGWAPRAHDQPHTATLNLSWPLAGGWILDAAWHLHTGWPTTPVTALVLPGAGDEEPGDEPGDDPGDESAVRGADAPQLAAVFGRLGGRRLGEYRRLDLRASRSWRLRRGRLTFFADVQNLLDHHNPAGYDLTLDEETGGLELQEELWPGVVPSFGIAWEL